jgi:cytoskeletal protein CcmA (bactofilin family)
LGAVAAGLLSIGRGIAFVGEITSCARLVVDGTVEGNLQRCQDMVIGEGGVFKGEARTENAEISGRIEGNLIVRKRLVIHPAGHVSGITTYGEIEIEWGGRIVGQVEAREGVQWNGD